MRADFVEFLSEKRDEKLREEVFSMELRVGQQIGSYRISKEISHGTYAYIYQASHVYLTSRIAALKLLYTNQIQSQGEANQFFQEAQTLEELRHPHILSVIDVNIYEGYPYTIMEFASNGSLRDRIRRLRNHPMPINDALTILSQVAEALQFAHQHHIVHSDVKPENVLFNAANEALMADFDIARSLSTPNGQVNGLGGTPPYMAPEQFQGKVRKESDQYALGCIAYELLTGKRPFQGDDIAALKEAHLHQQPIPPRQLNDALPLHIEQAILKALSKKPADRYTEIAQFVAALTAAQGVTGPLPLVGEPSKKLILRADTHYEGSDEEIFYEKTVVASADEQGSTMKKSPARKRTTTAKAKEAPARTTKAASTTKKQAADDKTVPAKRTTTRKPKTASTVKKQEGEAEKKPAVKKTVSKTATVKKSPVKKTPAAEKQSGAVTSKEPTVKKRTTTRAATEKKTSTTASSVKKAPTKPKAPVRSKTAHEEASHPPKK